MSEELNQIQTNDTEGFFDDVDEEIVDDSFEDEIEETEEAEEVEEVEETTEAEATEEAEQPFMRIRYNKEDLDLTQEEAIALAQKGKNYDKLNERYESQNKILKDLAQLNGMDVEGYLNSLNKVQENLLARQQFEALKEKYPESSDELLQDMANRLAQEQIANLRNQQVVEVQKQENTQKDELNKQLTRFEKRYPNVDASKLEDKVYQLMEEGYTLLEAYEEVQTAKNMTTQVIKQKNEQNKTKSFGSTSNVEAVDKDDFLSGFLSK